jgi:hypothetical protein
MMIGRSDNFIILGLTDVDMEKLKAGGNLAIAADRVDLPGGPNILILGGGNEQDLGRSLEKIAKVELPRDEQGNILRVINEMPVRGSA